MKKLLCAIGSTKISRVLAAGLLVASAVFSGTAFAAPVLVSVAAGPQSPDPVGRGGSASYAVTVTTSGNGNLDGYLSVRGLPVGVSASFSPNPVHFPSGSSTGSSTLVLSTSPATPPGSYQLALLADDGSSHNIVTNTFTLNVGLAGPGIARSCDGCMYVGWNAPQGSNCCVQATTNLIAPVWVTLCVTNSGTNNLMVYVDQDAPKYPCRFYRLKMP